MSELPLGIGAVKALLGPEDELFICRAAQEIAAVFASANCSDAAFTSCAARSRYGRSSVAS